MWDNPAQAFKELDSEEYTYFAGALAAYLTALTKEGFTRRESMRLVERYAGFIYDIAFAEYDGDEEEEEENDGDTVDPED